MFRLADFVEGTPLFPNLSVVAAEMMHDALNGWITGISDVEEIYTVQLAGRT